MKVLLLRTVKDVGARGQLVDVSDGYARNFLFPRDMASPATPGAVKYAARLKAAEDKKREERHRQEDELAEKLSGVSCTISRKAGEDEKLFGSVSGADIAEALKSQGFEIDRRNVELGQPIKSLGVHAVTVRVSARRPADVKVWVVRDTGKG